MSDLQRPALPAHLIASGGTGDGPGRPGPSGATRKDGLWPCQCMTCTACPGTTNVPASAIMNPTRGRTIRCTDCARAGHAIASATATDADAAPIVESTRKTYDTTVSAEERALDEMARRQTDEIHFKAGWDRWVASLPSRFENAALDEHVSDEDRAFIESVLANLRDDPTKGVNSVLFGRKGAGKTFLTYAMANTAIQRRLVKPQQVTHGTEAELIGEIGRVSKWERNRIVQNLISPQRRLFVIDEVGSDAMTFPEDRIAVWEMIADSAYRNDVALSLTTNLLPGKDIDPTIGDESHWLIKWIGAAAWDRIMSGTPNGQAHQVRNQNRRHDVRNGDIPRR